VRQPERVAKLVQQHGQQKEGRPVVAAQLSVAAEQQALRFVEHDRVGVCVAKHATLAIEALRRVARPGDGEGRLRTLRCVVLDVPDALLLRLLLRLLPRLLCL